MLRVRHSLAWGVTIGLLGLLLGLFGSTREFEADLGLGTLFGFRGPRVPPDNVVVVSIDRPSAEELGVSTRPDKWPRSLHGRLIDSLTRRGARVVVFDLYFSEPSAPAEDAALAAAMRRAGNVVLAAPLRVRPLEGVPATAEEHRVVELVEPIPVLAESAAAVAPFVLPGLPVQVHRYWTFQPGAGDAPTFPTVAFQLYALPAYAEFRRLLAASLPAGSAVPPEDLRPAVGAGQLRGVVRGIRASFAGDPSLAEKLHAAESSPAGAAIDERDRRLLAALVDMYADPAFRYLDHYGPARTVATVPFAQALREGAEAFDFRDKAVFVGVSHLSTTEREDRYFTAFSRDTGVFVSGVEIGATAFANLAANAPVKPVGPAGYVALILAWGLFAGILCRAAGTVAAGLAMIAASLLYGTAAAYAFRAANAWYPLVVPLLVQGPAAYFGAVLWRYFELYRERQNIRDALAHYVPDEVVQQLARDRIDAGRGGQTMYGVCLFSDLAGYTALSERMSPRELNDLMHRYFEAVFEPIKQNGGLVLALEGDAILAVWKGAAEEALHARACRAALGIVAAVQRFGEPEGAPALPTRIGVHAGQLYLGNIGAGGRYTYSVAGDTVNTASRLENLNKVLGTSILVSDTAARGLDGFLARPAGSFRLKGKTNPVVVHELLGGDEDATEARLLACSRFADALRAFRARRWGEAQELLERTLQPAGESAARAPATDAALVRFYLRRCDEFRRHPPPPNWDGVISTGEE